MDQPEHEISSKDDGRRRAKAIELWLKLRATQPREEDISEWLEWQRDPRNAEAFESIARFAGRIRVTDPKALTGLVAEFSPPTLRAPSRRLGWAMPLGVAAAVVIVAALMGYRWLAVLAGKTQCQEYQTPVAINRDIALPDGSNVLLGAESDLQTSFTASLRRVELRGGEAYFKVRHDEQRPFYVRAGKLTIRDVGTAFDVRKTGQRISITVAQGRVRVIETGSEIQGSDAANTVDIGPGQQVLYSPQTTGLRVASVDPTGLLGWRDQRLEFVNEPLASVVENINRYARHPLDISDPAIGQLSFTGTVDVHSLDRWIVALQVIFPVRVQHGVVTDAIVPATATHHH